MSKRQGKTEEQDGRGGTSSLIKGQVAHLQGSSAHGTVNLGQSDTLASKQTVTSSAGGFSGTTSLAGTELEVAIGKLRLSWRLGGQESGAQGGVAVLHIHVLPAGRVLPLVRGDPQAGIFVPQADQE